MNKKEQELITEIKERLKSPFEVIINNKTIKQPNKEEKEWQLDIGSLFIGLVIGEMIATIVIGIMISNGG